MKIETTVKKMINFFCFLLASFELMSQGYELSVNDYGKLIACNEEYSLDFKESSCLKSFFEIDEGRLLGDSGDNDKVIFYSINGSPVFSVEFTNNAIYRVIIHSSIIPVTLSDRKIYVGNIVDDYLKRGCDKAVGEGVGTYINCKLSSHIVIYTKCESEDLESNVDSCKVDSILLNNY